MDIFYWCPASRDQIKPLLVQPQISCNANGLYSCSKSYWQGYDKRYRGPEFPAAISGANILPKKKITVSLGRLVWRWREVRAGDTSKERECVCFWLVGLQLVIAGRIGQTS